MPNRNYLDLRDLDFYTGNCHAQMTADAYIMGNNTWQKIDANQN